MTSIPGFPSLCIFCCMQNRDVLGDSTFSPSETLLSINFLSLNLAIKLLTVLFSVVGSCSKCLWCSMSFNCFADPLLQSFISSITAAPPLLAFVMKISSRNFSSFNPFCFFPFLGGGQVGVPACAYSFKLIFDSVFFNSVQFLLGTYFYWFTF